ncbi:hypothetical protein ACEQUB_p00008 (plasmid) [Ralstonia syzygii]
MDIPNQHIHSPATLIALLAKIARNIRLAHVPQGHLKQFALIRPVPLMFLDVKMKVIQNPTTKPNFNAGVNEFIVFRLTGWIIGISWSS